MLHELDELYAALEQRGVQVAEEEAELPVLDEAQIGRLEHELSPRAWRWMTR